MNIWFQLDCFQYNSFDFLSLSGVKCLGVEPVHFGDVTIESTDYGGVVEYSCHSHYVMVSGNSTRECLANGTWSGQAPVCKSKHYDLSL